jgi:hypothetical protein
MLFFYFIPDTTRNQMISMRNTADVTGGKPIAVSSQSISGVSAVGLLAFYDIPGRKGAILAFSLILLLVVLLT